LAVSLKNIQFAEILRHVEKNLMLARYFIFSARCLSLVAKLCLYCSCNEHYV